MTDDPASTTRREMVAAALLRVMSERGPEARHNPRILRAMLNDALGPDALRCRAEVDGIVATSATTPAGDRPRSADPGAFEPTAPPIDSDHARWAQATWHATVVPDETTATPSIPQAPPRAERAPPPPASSKWRRVRWPVLASLPAAAIVVLAAVVFARPPDDTTPTPTPMPSPVQPFPDADERALLTQVPAAMHDTCARETNRDDRATAGVTCTAPEGAVVRFESFGSLRDLRAAYERARVRAGVDLDTGSCVDGPPAESGYEGDGVAGRAMCAAEGRVVVWTLEDARVLATAEPTDGEVELHAWWARLLGVRSDLELLLDVVPADIRDTCTTVEPDPAYGDAAVVHCRLPRGAGFAAFTRSVSIDHLRAGYADELAGPGVPEARADSCAPGVHMERGFAGAGGAEAGRVLCYAYDGQAHVVWRLDDRRVLGVAIRNDPDLDAVLAWWRGALPFAPELL